MVLVADVGNTNTVVALYEGEELHASWRFKTQRGRTADEHGAILRRFLAPRGSRLRGAAIASVVPPATASLVEACRAYLRLDPLVIGPGIRTGVRILYEDPRELGADRLANAVAAYQCTRGAAIVVDFGTATKFEFVSARGDYVGGAIAPGLGIASEALFSRAARRCPVEREVPGQVVGRTTGEALRAGLLLGHAALVDGMVRRICREQGSPARVIATGGLAARLAPVSETIEEVRPFLTLEGIRILWERNRR